MNNQGMIREPERQTPVITRTDVLVVGGGSAGTAAAIAAARQGARVVLAERYGSLGGIATGGLVALFLTLDDGRARQVIAGICQETTERMKAVGGAFHPPREHWGRDDEDLIRRYGSWGLVWGHGPHRVRYSVAYDPEVLREILSRMVLEAGVELILHLWAADALLEGDRLIGVAFQSKAGRCAILADVVIDATGDGDVYRSAGCRFELERVHPWLWFRMGGVSNVEETLAGEGWFFRTPNPGQLLLPWGSSARIERRIDATDPRDLTYAEVECRRLVMEEYRRLRKALPGMRDAHLCNIATQLGITESCRLLGRYLLRREDMNHGFEDTVAITGHWTKYGAVYAIPYRCLQPAEIVNLLAAGRNISVEHRVHHATKEIPCCMAVGEAAGIAAAMALSCNGDVTKVDTARLRHRLCRAGALVDYPFCQS